MKSHPTKNKEAPLLNIDKERIKDEVNKREDKQKFQERCHKLNKIYKEHDIENIGKVKAYADEAIIHYRKGNIEKAHQFLDKAYNALDTSAEKK